MLRLAIVFIVSLLAAQAAAAPLPIQYVGNFSVPNPSFLALLPVSSSNSIDLVISSFTGNPFVKGAIYTIPNIGSHLGNLPATKYQTINTQSKLQWPNSFDLAPEGIFSELTLMVADGFLVPGKSTGGIYAVQPGSGKVLTLTTPKDSYFYHFFEWVDMNKDGRLDLVTARAYKSIFGSTDGELLWLEQPADASQFPWTEHVLTKGPDVFITVASLDGNSNTVEILSAEFFSQRVTMTVVDISSSTPSVTKYLVIDDSIGPAYAIRVVDLNVDGKLELVVTNHAATKDKSAMFSYEVPSDPVNSQGSDWTRSTLAYGFPITEGGFNQAAPGFPYIFHPRVTAPKSEKPSILLAGDGSQSAYYFSPTDTPLKYDGETIIKTPGTVGALCFGDVNGDSYSEVFVPDYDHGIVHVFTFAPKNL